MRIWEPWHHELQLEFLEREARPRGQGKEPHAEAHQGLERLERAPGRVGPVVPRPGAVMI